MSLPVEVRFTTKRQKSSHRILNLILLPSSMSSYSGKFACFDLWMRFLCLGLLVLPPFFHFSFLPQPFEINLYTIKMYLCLVRRGSITCNHNYSKTKAGMGWKSGVGKMTSLWLVTTMEAFEPGCLTSQLAFYLQQAVSDSVNLFM